MFLGLDLMRGLIVTALLIAFQVVIYTGFMRKKRLFPLPPGPPDSDVIYTKVLGQHTICLNSVQAATDLLDKRGANYNDRPRFALFEVMGWGLTLTFLPWGPQFKLHRKLFQSTFTQTNVKAFRLTQIFESRKAVRSLLKDPTKWEKIILLMTTSIIFRIAFGQEAAELDSPYCHLSNAANDATTNGGVAGTTLVDLFPPARFLPDFLNPSRSLRHARESRKAIQTVHDMPWEANMKDIDAGIAAQCFMKTHWERLQENQKAGLNQELTLLDIKGATGAVFIAGGNTTWATILSCMLFLTKYPKIQKKVLSEVDALLSSGGEHRFPTFDDRDKLTYLHNFIQETMRMLPLNPLVIPHKSIADDVYKGMFIPAGTTIFANTRAMSMNAAVYKDPQSFEPERYERGEPYPSNFGFGRRKCPGNFLALASVYMFLSTFLAVFELEQVLGDDGKPKLPEPSVSAGLGGWVEDGVVLRGKTEADL